MQIIDKIVIVHPSVNTWGGKKRLDPEDLGGNYDLPSDLVSLGDKRIVPKKTLRPFETFKKKLDRTLSGFGVKLIGGYAVAEDNIDTVTAKLDELEEEFRQIRDSFILNFNTYVEEQVHQYPEWSDVLRAAAAEIQPVLPDRFSFRYKAYKIVPPGKQGDEGLDEDLDEKFVSDDEFESQAAAEIGVKAYTVLARLAGKEEIKPVSLNPIQGIRSKLLNLTPLNRKLFGGAVQLIDIVMGEMPEGTITGRERELVSALLLFLRSMTEEPQRSNFLAGEYDSADGLLEGMGFRLEAHLEPDEADSEAGEEMAAEGESFIWF